MFLLSQRWAQEAQNRKICWFKALNCCTAKYQATASRCLITQCQPKFHRIQFSLAEDICSATTKREEKKKPFRFKPNDRFSTSSAFLFLYLTSLGITDAVCAENQLCHRLVWMPRCWGNEEASLPAQFSGHYQRCGKIYSMQKESIWCSVAGSVSRTCSKARKQPEGVWYYYACCWRAERIRGSGRWTSAKEWIQWIRANHAAL